MTGIYFSGTGNTAHCVRRFLRAAGEEQASVAIEDEKALEAVRTADELVFGFPVYFSSLPVIVRDFILKYAAAFQGKRIFILATMGLFSGDGAGCAARLLKKCGAIITGGLHVRMPDCIGDNRLLKKTDEKNRAVVARADEKLDRAAEDFKVGKYPRDGLGFFCRVTGLLGQRFWFYGKTKRYYAGIKCDDAKCVGCGLCARHCPTANISIEAGKAHFNGKCTMCYRCFSLCPERAITVLGKKVYVQYAFKGERDGA